MIYKPSQRVIMISIRGDVTAPAGHHAPDRAAQTRYVMELATGLARLEHDVEVWTRQCGDRRETEVTPAGVRVRRFPCGDCGSVRELTPCEYIAEWVARATEHAAPLPADETVLASHFWDAGIAGRLLATRFGLTHVHVPHELAFEEYPTQPADGPAARNLARRAHEEREVCRTASRVVATTPSQQRLLSGHVYRLPPGKVAVLPRPSAAQDFLDILSSTPGGSGHFGVARRGPAAERHPDLGRFYDRPQGVESRLAGAAGSIENDSIL